MNVVPFSRRVAARGGGWGWIAVGVFAAVAGVGGRQRAGAAEGVGTEVVVLFNAAMAESRATAEHYAERRGVPTNRVIGLDLPTQEEISRETYEQRIEQPLVRELTERGLVQIRDQIVPATETAPGRVVRVLSQSQVRFLAICYGVPLRIAHDSTRVTAASASLPEVLRRNGAAVDAELTALPLLLAGQPIGGPMANPWVGTTNAALLTPPNGVFVVGRLDGPTPEMARRLVDLALEAEENGLWGRAYFDLRMSPDPAYAVGDTWISNAWTVATRYGFEAHLDRGPKTLSKGFPLSHVALYAGWYDGDASGPFALPQVEFMPGAVAYHLHSFSAATLRSSTSRWVGPLVARGVTATMGCVAEPLLDGTPDIGTAFERLLFAGFRWGEAALASQQVLSWQLTVVGDPLYRPFATHLLDRYKALIARGQGRSDWALTMLYNRRRRAGGDLGGVIAELEKEKRLRFSPVLEEKLADFLREAGRQGDAAEWYRRALAWQVSPQQRKRLLWNAAEAYQAAGETEKAYGFYAELAQFTEPPPEPILLLERLQSLAAALKRDDEAKKWEQVRATYQGGLEPK